MLILTLKLKADEHQNITKGHLKTCQRFSVSDFVIRHRPVQIASLLYSVMKTSRLHKCNHHTSSPGLVESARGKSSWKPAKSGQKVPLLTPPYTLPYPILQILLQTPHGHELHTTITRNLGDSGIYWYDLPSVDIVLSIPLYHLIN